MVGNCGFVELVGSWRERVGGEGEGWGGVVGIMQVEFWESGGGWREGEDGEGEDNEEREKRDGENRE